MGMPREELKSRLGLPARAFNEAVPRAASEGVLVETGAFLHLAEHQVLLDPEQQKRVDQLLARFRSSPYAPPSVADSKAVVGAELLAALIEQGHLIKVSDTILFSAQAYQRMKQTIVEYLQREGTITLGQMRDMFQTSRKYAQGMLEHLDDQRITRRVGDERMLR
jgi:selenocysteine-specific elongation factor